MKMKRASCCILVAILQCLVFMVHGHGYLSSPRSRNLVAHEETVWWPQTELDPMPETCPHCLNRGGTLARCGIVGDPSGTVRNYDTPKNALGGEMPIKIQANYTQGEIVTLNVSLTAHHKGHFVFSACPISSVGEVPTQECFDKNQFTFVEDLLWGATPDANYPMRAYIAPPPPNYVLDVGSTKGVMKFSFRMKLPPKVYGDVVLIQWYYLTANSCYHEGYEKYNWPTQWNFNPTSSQPCGDVSPDGSGVPEQFWNCAEVRVFKGPDELESSASQFSKSCFAWLLLLTTFAFSI